MQYHPELSVKEIEDNHRRFNQRVSLYREKGPDFVKSRRFILEKAGYLQGNILEIGAGTGYTALSLAKAGYKFISIDIDEESLKTAALNLAYENLLSNATFHMMDGKSMTFESGSFDNIICVNLFHHVNNVDKMLLEIDRVLRVNGKAVLSDFNKKGMEIVNAVHRQEGHIHEDSGATRKSVYSYLHGLGYDVETYDEGYHWLMIGEKKTQK